MYENLNCKITKKSYFETKLVIFKMKFLMIEKFFREWKNFLSTDKILLVHAEQLKKFFIL